MAWTKEQQEAIQLDGRNILVAAAAGSGKTSVLVQRILRKIAPEGGCPGMDVDRLLVVTFTRAAAGEMRDRLYQSIQVKLEQGGVDCERLQEQQALLNKSYIMTIHAFCQDVIRRFFLESGVDSSFRIGEESEMQLLQEDALGTVLEAWYAKQDPAFLRLVETYGGRQGDKGLVELLLSMYRFIQSEPFPKQWLELQKERYCRDDVKDFGETLWGQEMLRDLSIRLQGMEEEFLQSEEIAREGRLDGHAAALFQDRQLIGNLLSLCRQGSWQRLWEAFRGLSFVKLPPISTKDDRKELAEQVRKSREQLKKALQKLATGLFGGASDAPLRDRELLAPDISCLVTVLEEFEEAFQSRKRQKHLLDYADLEHLALDVLATEDEQGRLIPSPAAEQYRRQFEEVYVDEYQDTNFIQETILALVSRWDTEKPNLFQVGDVKQSIYGFRQARPDLFLKKYQRYQLETEANRLICLSTNFRSRRNIVGSVNYSFQRLMHQATCGMEYTQAEALRYGANYYDEADRTYGGTREDACEFLLATELKGETGERPLQFEARLIAKRIRALYRDAYPVYDKEQGALRKVEYRDMVILLRALSGKASVIAEVLRSEGIPVYCEEKSGFFNSYEVSTMLSYLRLLDNPLQDIPLLAVLRSPLYGFTEGELAEIRLCQREGLFYNACLKRRDSGEDALAKKLKLFTEQLRYFRHRAGAGHMAELVWEILQTTGYYALVGLQTDGETRQENLQLLFHRAAAFEQGNHRGIFPFVRYMERLQNRKMDLESASGFQEGMNAVRIMTVHKSKGLEFPVVFLSGMGKPFNTQDAKQRMLRHRSLGFGPSCLDEKRHLLYPSIMKESVRIRLDRELKAEELRLLYVAMTRAREKLIVTAGWEDSGEAFWEACRLKCRRRDGLPGDYRILSAKSSLEWLGLCLANYHTSPQDETTSCFWRFGEWTKDQLVAGGSETPSDEAFAGVLVLPPEEEEERLEASVTGSELRDLENRVSSVLGWTYPGSLSAPPSKVSVSEIKRWQEQQFEEGEERLLTPPLSLRDLPDFMQEENSSLSPAERGTLLHACLQHVDLEACRQILAQPETMRKGLLESLVEALVDRLVDQEFFSPRQGCGVERSLLVRFIQSDLFQRMLQAKQVWREVPFTFLKSWGSIRLDDPANETPVAVQGILDCYWEEEDGLVLVDFKSDSVRPGEEAIVAERYAVQLSCYREALAAITGRKVKETLLYFLRSGTVWQDA